MIKDTHKKTESAAEIHFNPLLSLKERVKELDCLYRIEDALTFSDDPVEEILNRIVHFIPPAFHYADIACARILFNGREFQSRIFKATQWSLARPIMLKNEKAGAVEVYYLEEKPDIDAGPFLKEEERLIETIASRIGKFCERKRAEEKLRHAQSELEIRVRVRTAELTRVNEELRQSERFLSSVFFSIQDGISILDKELTILRVNPIMEKWYAHAMPLVGKKCYQAYHCANAPCRVCPTKGTLHTGKVAYEIVPKRGPRGSLTGWLDLYSFPLLDPETGELKGVIEYVRDITAKKRAEEKLAVLNKELVRSNNRLRQLSLTDSHTGLFNHRYLGQVIEAEFDRAKRYAHALAVIMMDIDYFKSINDVYGHQFGDLVLKQCARLLKRMVRKYDVLIRLGGEEFIVVSPGLDRQQGVAVAQRLLDAINLYNFGDKTHTVKVKLSLAVASYPEDRAHKGGDLINLADQILNKAKEYGGNRVYSPQDVQRKEYRVPDVNKETEEVKLLKGKIDKLSRRANQSLVEAVFAFAKAIELKDHYTGEHTDKTVWFAKEIAKELGLSAYETEKIGQAALLHDLGKIGISEKILLKKGKLTKKEFEEIKRHPQIGADIIRPIQFLHSLIPSIFYHHEHWDGKGYPSGLKGEEIPVGARIIAIADVYQALTSDRPYRKAYAKKEAVKIIRDSSGTQFDPTIVDAFLRVLKRENSNKGGENA